MSKTQIALYDKTHKKVDEIVRELNDDPNKTKRYFKPDVVELAVNSLHKKLVKE